MTVYGVLSSMTHATLGTVRAYIDHGNSGIVPRTSAEPERGEAAQRSGSVHVAVCLLVATGVLLRDLPDERLAAVHEGWADALGYMPTLPPRTPWSSKEAKASEALVRSAQGVLDGLAHVDVLRDQMRKIIAGGTPHDIRIAQSAMDRLSGSVARLGSIVVS